MMSTNNSLSPTNPEPSEYKLTTDGVAAVTNHVKWIPIDINTPLGVKMLVIHKPSGVAVISIRARKDIWTHWYPLPTF